MTYSTQQFSDRVSNNLKSQVVGFDFTIFVPIVIQILSEVLGNCGKSKEEIIRSMQNAQNDFWAQTVALQAVRKSLHQSGEIMSLRDQIKFRDAICASVGDGRSAVQIYEDVSSMYSMI